ncbi:MAG: TIGR01777 family oxidoreductase [Ferruginibacter sp.]
MDTVLITGGTGMVGKALTTLLNDKGYRVIILTRKLPLKTPSEMTRYALWNVAKQEIDINAVQQADHIIHLAGAGVMDKRWSSSYKKEIQDSRIKSSELLVKTLKENNNKVKTVVSASAIGWYGKDRNDIIGKGGFTETDPPDTGFLGETCRLWEQSIQPVQDPGKRLVILRTGIVLGNEGGAFPQFKQPIQFGIAAILGNGRQIISWIHIEDLCRLYINALDNGKMNGIYNAVAPFPVDNKTLVLSVAKKLRGKIFIPIHVPAFILKLVLGESSIEVLKSTYVSSGKIKQTGFTFLYPSVDAALNELCS